MSTALTSLADRLYRCTKCGKEARTNGPVNDWYQRCIDNNGHNWKEKKDEGDDI
jgi:hypothetical protein